MFSNPITYISSGIAPVAMHRPKLLLHFSISKKKCSF